MTQATFALFGDVCGEQYAFDRGWRRIFLRRGISDAPLFCAEPRGHAGRHVDKATGIPWGEER